MRENFSSSSRVIVSAICLGSIEAKQRFGLCVLNYMDRGIAWSDPPAGSANDASMSVTVILITKGSASTPALAFEFLSMCAG